MNCRAINRFFGFDLSGDRPAKIFVDPDPNEVKLPLKDIEILPERVKKAYLAILASYNADLHDSVAMSARRALEGVIKLSWPDPSETRDKTLYNLITELPNKVSLSKPIVDMAHALREGGNLAAHFDLEKDMDPKLSIQIIEMIEYIIEYLYIIPEKVQQLKIEMDK